MFYAAYRANISQPGPVQWNKYCRKWYKNGVWSLMVVVNSWTDRNTSTFEGYSIQRLPEGIIAGYSSLEEGVGTSRAIVYEPHIQYSYKQLVGTISNSIYPPKFGITCLSFDTRLP
ncbi:uncharacterized protein GVI51_J03817 [Nakaseomyces glabratus]|uniref:Uncharacterized protein n=1 Tax=Candida glabrata (strain ATCC 2001 / BCRC 20586 / JCM 3761 / NBRC 0622 / NRRL Y-65 / CBS 138) TaxID=284593 RepID=Q6FPG6_CANGA|nr:uncharacterized protein CAGL0J03982g [Nakaseomyces glabratus]KAH7583972.1 hypothetical protein J7298_03170 [Nakaseomyces glabratus]KAH7597716.1 hypothetical protein J7295_03174 [Nakaseomyces glabratus]KAH7599146.1 hypothetical protein J7294_03160 [Nakaseomyces glabratus]KAH7603724.1 hypothetical protein J7293_03277 [Nakaseomyces glabratus]KAH7612461.1 hypothetical protein J7292_03152 [Nakaseomyces glabratus]|eukprot:XP_447878.1 uncharacterized protein CAGL0J03982g [[Candida] glabrata]